MTLSPYEKPGAYSKLDPQLEMIDSYMKLHGALKEIDPIGGSHVLSTLEPYIHQNKKIKFGKAYSVIVNDLMKDDFCAEVLKNYGVPESFEVYTPRLDANKFPDPQRPEEDVLVSREFEYEAPSLDGKKR